MEESVFRKSDSVVSRKIDDETIVVPIRQNVGDLESIYTLNEVGARVWELLDGKNTVRQIIQMITNEYDVGADQSENDVLDFLKQLIEINMVELYSKKI